jgi:3-oxoacyl-[acyl-carrier-protein] synthase-1
LARYDCRAGRILSRAVAQDGFIGQVARARTRYGADRIGCFIGTIGAGLGHLEECYRTHDVANGDLGEDVRIDHTAQLFSPTEQCRHILDIDGPAATISTACSSSAKVFCTAYRYLAAGLCDAVVVGGIDCANEGFIYGFRSLGLLSASPCRPWDRKRDGLSIGEAAGFALIERRPRDADAVAMLGFGETSDSYHPTAPHPEGDGAEMAMRDALRRAGLQPSDIDYINLHGSGTPANDVSEDRAILRVFGNETPCSSTKSWTGHAQGAAGIAEAILSMQSLQSGIIPATLNMSDLDPALGARVVTENVMGRPKRALSNSFGFGGNNCTLIFGSVP